VVRDVAELRTGDGRELPCLLRIELERLRRRLVLALELIHEVEADRAEALAATADDKMTQKIAALQRLRGIGPNFAAVLVREVLSRSFANRRQLASYVGIAPMPYQSGGWIATEALAERATRGPARRSSSSPGFGCATSRAVRSPHGSVSASACCRDAHGGSPLWQWRGSC
jgi:transposase